MPNTPAFITYTTQRQDGESWTSLPGGTLITGDPNAEADDFPAQGGTTFAYRICATGTAPGYTVCSDPAQITTPADMPTPP